MYPIATMCRCLGVCTSGYYGWRRRQPSSRSRSDAELLAKIREAYEASGRRYGAPKIQAELAAQGIRVGRKRIARLMRSAGLRGVTRRKAPRTTIRKQDQRPAPDLVDRDFSASGPNRLWVADITYVPTWAAH
jgi:putative transposase